MGIGCHYPNHLKTKRMTQENTKLYYFDPNRRVYELNAVKKNSPYYECYFIPLEVLYETDKEIVCRYGVVKKKTMEYACGRTKYKVYTESEKDDLVYFNENAHLLSERVRNASVTQLRAIEKILNT